MSELASAIARAKAAGGRGDAAPHWAALGAMRRKLARRRAPKTHVRAWDWEVTECGRPAYAVAIAGDEGATCKVCRRATA